MTVVSKIVERLVCNDGVAVDGRKRVDAGDNKGLLSTSIVKGINQYFTAFSQVINSITAVKM